MNRAALAVFAALTAGVLFWLLLDGGPSRDDAPHALPAARDADAARDAAPAAPATDAPTPRALAAPDGVAAPADDAPAWPDGFETMTVSGRVLDPSGAPVAGAEVLQVPSGYRSAYGELRDWVGEASVAVVTREQLVGTRTDARGRFQLAGPWHDDGGERMGDDSRVFPELIVLAEGWGAHRFACLGFAGGHFAAGELVLERPGAEVVVRFEDPGGAPVPGVRASVEDAFTHAWPREPRYPGAGLPPFAVVSDASGTLLLPWLWTGEQTLDFVHPDWVPAEQRVELAAGERLDLGVWRLLPRATLRGTVRDRSGAPLAGAHVSALPHAALARYVDGLDVDAAFLASHEIDGPRAGVSTDADGRYELRGLDRGVERFVVTALAPGHEPALLDHVAPDSDGNDLVLEPQAELRVRVVAASDGRPLPEAELRAFRDLGRWLGVWGVEVRDVREIPVEGDVVQQVGAYGTRLLASAPGFTMRLHDVPGQPPGSTREVELALEPAQATWVRVVDTAGAPIPDALVQLAPPEEWGAAFRPTRAEPQPEARTSAAGLARFDGLGTGRWRARAHAEGFFEARETLAVPAGEPLELTLERPARIRGRLLDPAGAPAVGETLQWERETTGWHTVTDLEGRFAFDVPGQAGVLRAPRVAARELEPVAGETLELELVQLRPFVVTGEVTAGGAPLAGVHVLVGSWDGTGNAQDFVSATTDAHGAFRLEALGEGPHVVAAWWQGAALNEPVEARFGEQRHVRLDFGRAALAGRVEPLDPSVRLDEVTLALLRDRKVVSEVPLDPDGGFAFDPLPDGSYALEARGGGALRERFGPWELAAGETRRDLLLRVAAGAEIAGRALHADGRPFRGSVHLRAVDGAGYEVRAADWRHGGFRFEALAPGTWQLDLATTRMPELGAAGKGEPGAELPFFAREVVTLAPGEVREVDLRIAGAPP